MINKALRNILIAVGDLRYSYLDTYYPPGTVKGFWKGG